MFGTTELMRLKMPKDHINCFFQITRSSFYRTYDWPDVRALLLRQPSFLKVTTEKIEKTENENENILVKEYHPIWQHCT